MNIETIRDKKDLLLREIERDQRELVAAVKDLRNTVSVAPRIEARPKTWLIGAFVTGLIIGELT